MNKIYISGKITGIEDKAFELFENAEKELSIFGIEILNPMKLPHEHGKTWHEFMIADLRELSQCDSIYMLKNWRQSRGAKIEFKYAIKHNYEIIYQ